MSHNFIKSIEAYQAWLNGKPAISFQALSQTLAPWPARSQASRRNGERIQRAWAKLQALPPDEVQSPRATPQPGNTEAGCQVLRHGHHHQKARLCDKMDSNREAYPEGLASSECEDRLSGGLCKPCEFSVIPQGRTSVCFMRTGLIVKIA